MRTNPISLVSILLGLLSLAAQADEPFGLTERKPWTTSTFHGQPELPPPFRAERVFPTLQFAGPTVLIGAPGSKRWFVAERTGKIFSFPQDGSAAKPDLFLDCTDLTKQLTEQEKQQVDFQALYGLTFDPKFEQNRFCYVCYVVHRRVPNQPVDPQGTRVARVRVSDTNPPRCEIDSEKTIIAWREGGHNGGCLKFGPEGFLYISTGDGSTAFPPDELKTGQDLSDLLSSILRIDVHPADAKLPYSIPVDNPFVSLEKARGENWAYGLRNPWKMSFDRTTGELWVGDVGWELWELVYRVRKGENYGWSLVEGRQPVHVEGTPGPTPVIPPTVEIPHTDGASITGGFVYRGKQFPELVGQYIFGDWETRRIWGVKVDGDERDGNKVGQRQDLVEPTVRIVDFAENDDGELFLLDNDTGTIHALVRNAAKPTHLQFPRKLSETGIFESVPEHRLAAGVLPFSINAEQWSDYAIAERHLALPEKASIGLHPQAVAVPGKQNSRTMDFPAETVLTKTLSLDLIQGDAASRRRIETQVLHFDGNDWRGYSYEWNDEQTDAMLVSAEGKSRTWNVQDSQAPGGKRVQAWQFAARNDCIRCHNPWSEYTLAFNIAQLNRAHDYGSVTDNQIRTLKHIGVLVDIPIQPGTTKPEPAKAPDQLPRLADLHQASTSLEQRSRAYLHVNCAHCHRFNGGGSAHIYLQHDLPLAGIKAVDLRPTQGTFGIRDARILAPADPYRSVLLFRLAKSGPGHMPHLGSKFIDHQGVTLIHDWIASLPGKSPDSGPALSQLSDDKGNAIERTAAITELLATPSQALRLAQALRERRISEANRKLVTEAALQQTDLAIRDLFEPFVPEEQRTKRLGESIRPQEILALAGDVGRGRQLFHESTVTQCRSCHRSEGKGGELGPDLSAIGKKLDRAKILDSILQPSASIDPKYAGWLVETKSGTVVTGLLIEKTDAAIVIKNMQNVQQRIATDEIEGLYPQRKSLMPDLLLRDYTAAQVADLLAYLSSLK